MLRVLTDRRHRMLLLVPRTHIGLLFLIARMLTATMISTSCLTIAPMPRVLADGC